jgi:hypothetical protein
MELIPRMNRFLPYEILSGTFRKRERAHVVQCTVDEQSFTASKNEFHGQWATLFRTVFLLGSFLVPTRFLVPTMLLNRPAGLQGVCLRCSLLTVYLSCAEPLTAPLRGTVKIVSCPEKHTFDYKTHSKIKTKTV